MTGIASFRDVLDLWPDRAELAKRLGVGARGRPITPAHLRVWYQRNRISPKYFDRLISAARACGYEEVTYPLLTRLWKAIPHHRLGRPPQRAG